VFLMQRNDRPAMPAIDALVQMILNDLQMESLRPEIRRS